MSHRSKPLTCAILSGSNLSNDPAYPALDPRKSIMPTSLVISSVGKGLVALILEESGQEQEKQASRSISTMTDGNPYTLPFLTQNP